MVATPVLIIDDEPSLRDGLKEFLDDEGYDVHLAANGNEGLTVFQRLKPDLVVTDLRMPGISGMELIRHIKTAHRDTAVIVITGYGSMESAVDAIRLDVFDFITKPIDLDKLKETLDRAQDHLGAAQKVQEEIDSLRRRMLLLQNHFNDYKGKMSELEPLIHAGRLMAGILHNLNSPLTYIMGQAQLLQLLHPEVDNLKKIGEQAARMDEIISTILKKVKQSQNREKKWLKLNDILREEVSFLDSDFYFRHEVHKEWRLDPDLPAFEGVASDFAQVFSNLLRNAAEAMRGHAGEEKKKIIITSSHDKSGIYISVSDTGPGIPEYFYENLFQPFFSTKTKEVGISGSVGMGLGLYSCKQIIEQYGGTIELKSRQGRSAAFLIHLPVPVGTRRDTVETKS